MEIVASALLAILAGLVSGSLFVALFAAQFYPPDYTAPFDEITYPLDIRPNSGEILHIIENNATIVEQFKSNHLTLFYVTNNAAAGDKCPPGSCGHVIAESRSGTLQIYVNYEKDYVAFCFEQRFDAIYNRAGERLALDNDL